MTKKPTRADAVRIIDEADAERLASLMKILARPEVQQAQADIEALLDPSEDGQPHEARSVNGLIRNAVVPFQNVPHLAEAMARTIDQRLNPPEAPQGRLAPAPAPAA